MKNTKLGNGAVALITIGCLFAKFVAFITIGFTLLVVLGSLIPTEPARVTGIEIKNDTLHVEVGTPVSQYVFITATESYSEEDLQFISENESIATVEFKEISMSSYVYFTVTGHKNGTTAIHFENADGTVVSDSITVVVTGESLPPKDEDQAAQSTDISSSISSEGITDSSESTSTSTKQPTSSSALSSTQKPTTSDSGTSSDTETPSDKPTSTQTNSTSSETTNDSSGSGVTVPDHSETGKDLVWVPVNGGKKYHKKSTCSNMIDPIQVTRETAIANGYTSCGRCKP